MHMKRDEEPETGTVTLFSHKELMERLRGHGY